MLRILYGKYPTGSHQFHEPAGSKANVKEMINRVKQYMVLPLDVSLLVYQIVGHGRHGIPIDRVLTAIGSSAAYAGGSYG
jgi:hypothetical protein